MYRHRQMILAMAMEMFKLTWNPKRKFTKCHCRNIRQGIQLKSAHSCHGRHDKNVEETPIQPWHKYVHPCKHTSNCTHPHKRTRTHIYIHNRETMMMMVRLCLDKWWFNHMTLTISARGITPSVVCSMGLTPSIIVTCRHTCSDSYHEAKKQDKLDGHGGWRRSQEMEER